MARGPKMAEITNKPQVADLGLPYGAGDGNRTRALSLGSSCSTIKLHPRDSLGFGAKHRRTLYPIAARRCIWRFWGVGARKRGPRGVPSEGAAGVVWDTAV